MKSLRLTCLAATSLVIGTARNGARRRGLFIRQAVGKNYNALVSTWCCDAQQHRAESTDSGSARDAQDVGIRERIAQQHLQQAARKRE